MGRNRLSSILVTSLIADPFDTIDFNPSAPLITAASALFGNNSFLNIADPHNNLTATQLLALMCQHGSIPFALPLAIQCSPDFGDFCFGSNIAFDSQTTEDADNALAGLLIETYFFNRFNYTHHAEYIRDMSMFFANCAVLNKAPGARETGQDLTGTIIVSVLIAMQLAGLGLFIWYIYSVPTWTTSLDALAVAQIARGVPEGEIPPLGPVSEKKLQKMQEVDALVGVKNGAQANTGNLEDSGYLRSGSGTNVSPIGDKKAAASSLELTIGGPRLIGHGIV
ncbi:hypothetical protein K438DRAFT_1787382 [Mycena galopus ATCC 62051]|nr:hypothetical protein K438DRAFT_1787382 [Mycena galopus ATCC 62051]